ncbi:MAG TPA: hypothetical protein VGH84_05015 [Steroidobacteraceae bacterium]
MNLLLLGGSQIELMECVNEGLVPAPTMMALPVVMMVMVMVMPPVMAMMVVTIPAVLAPVSIRATALAIVVHGVRMHCWRATWTCAAGIRSILSPYAAGKTADRQRQNQSMQCF